MSFEVGGRNHVVWLFKWNLFSFWVCDQSNESFWAVLFCCIGSVLVYWLNCLNFGNCKQNSVVWPVWLFFWVSEQTLSVIIQTKHFWHQLFVVTVFVLILSLWPKSFGRWPFKKNPFKWLTFSSFWKLNINSGWEKYVAQWLGYTSCILHVCPYFNSL